VYSEQIDIEFDQEELPVLEEEVHENHPYQRNRIKDLTDRERQDIYEALLEVSNNGKLKKNSTSVIAYRFNISRRTVQRVWQRAMECRAIGVPVDVRSKKPNNSGRKRVSVELSEVARIPLHKRTTIRSLAEELGIKKSTLHRWFREGELRRHSSSLKPFLKEANKIARLRWCLSMLDQHTLPNDPKFIEMEYIIHSDEKWFNASKKRETYYLLPDEEDPHRTVQNKNSIEKVMLYSGVAKPRFDASGNCTFDGKLSVWPFVRKVSY